MKNIKNLEDMMEAFRHIFRDIDDKHDLMVVLRMADDYCFLQEKVQKLPLRLRLKYWACTSVIFFYLQMNKQLGRNVGPFSDSVNKNVYKVFQAMIKEYDGTGNN